MVEFDREKGAIEMTFEENAMGLSKASLHFAEKVCKIENGEGAYVISYGTAEEPAEIVFPGTQLKTFASGEWTDDHTFLVKLDVVEEDFSPVFFEFGFSGENAVSAHFKNTSEPEFLRNFSGFAGGVFKRKRKIWTNRKKMVR